MKKRALALLVCLPFVFGAGCKSLGNGQFDVDEFLNGVICLDALLATGLATAAEVSALGPNPGAIAVGQFVQSKSLQSVTGPLAACAPALRNVGVPGSK